MTDEEIIKAVSEIDGWAWQEGPPTGWKNPATGVLHILRPDYLGSRDAIIPVIEKQAISYAGSFADALLVLEPKLFCCNSCTVFIALTATPHQLCEALLRAKGRWVE